MRYDYDFVIVGSGFGGSVSALRLAEKGYSVAVLEMGKRWNAEDFPSTNMKLRRYVWEPRAMLYGFFNLFTLPDVFIARGVGVGGGSLVYANTLFVPPDKVWSDPKWADLADWKAALKPHYETAQRMLGAVPAPRKFETEDLLQEYGREIGRPDHDFHPVDVGVYFGQAGVTVPDPNFGGEGPARTGCTYCGRCMVGCKVGAKNTLDKNYLYLAEKRGVTVIPERKVSLVEPLDGADGAKGYRLHIERSTHVFLKDRKTLTARAVVLSGGVLGTVPLLLASKEAGALPRVSDRIGDIVRTNSESFTSITDRREGADHSKGLAIMASLKVDDQSNIEMVRYPAGSDFIGALTTVLTDGGKGSRKLAWLGQIFRHPIKFARTLWPFGWAKSSNLLMIMQTADNHLRLRLSRRWFWPFSKSLVSELPKDQAPTPTYIPQVYEASRWFEKRMGGAEARSALPEVLLNLSTTAHILGGCPMGKDAAGGVIDWRNRVHGYDNLYVVDGSMISANLGVNPSLTITAIAEHAMSQMPTRAEAGW